MQAKLIWFVVTFSAAVAQNFEPDAAICGGALESDGSQIIFEESLQPGQVCVWSIHLNTFRDFGFNFSTLDLHSISGDCSDVGIRVYGLTNYAPPNEAPSYTFCNERPPPDTFYLGYNVAVVVAFFSSGSHEPGVGFQLNWEGASFDPMNTLHLSSYSTAYEGLIKYPISGSYPLNVAATWLIKARKYQQPTNSDLIFQQVGLEQCAASPADPCRCDALMLFEIGWDGILSERSRICASSEEEVYERNLEGHFVLAFFTDYTSLPGGGGFHLTYSEHRSEVTTESPTTEEATSSMSTMLTSTTTTTRRPCLPTGYDCQFSYECCSNSCNSNFKFCN